MQLALGFLVGLCVFCLSVHPSIGLTSIPLVGTWASLIFIAFFSPLLSSRSPYRTTLLPDFMKRCRLFILRHPRQHRVYVGTLVDTRIARSKTEVHDPRPSSLVPLVVEDKVARRDNDDYEVLSSVAAVIKHLHDYGSLSPRPPNSTSKNISQVVNSRQRQGNIHDASIMLS